MVVREEAMKLSAQ
jgi:hypothetical protein